MTKCNLHTHTDFSDGRDSAGRMVEEAIARGFQTLGFSDHGSAPWDTASMPPEREAPYRAEIRRLAKVYAGQIEIPLGYERDATMPDTDISVYDYAIESVHFLCKNGEKRAIDDTPVLLEKAVNELFGGDWYAAARHYFREVCESLEGVRGEIVGHIGLIAKFNEKHPRFDETDARYTSGALEAMRCACEKGKIIEVNTGAMSRGWRSVPYPTPDLLRALHGMGGRVILSSDCHRAEWEDWAFDETREMIKNCGFRSVWVWKDGGFAEEEI